MKCKREVGKVISYWSKELGGVDIEIPHFDSTEKMIGWLQGIINYLKELEKEKEHPVIISEVFIRDKKIQITFGERGICFQPGDNEVEALNVKDNE